VYYVIQTLMVTPQFWFSVMIVCVICLVPEIIFRYVVRMYVKPSRLNVIEELEHVYPQKREKFVMQIQQHLQKQQQKDNQEHEEDAKETTQAGFLGFAEFQLDPSHPDYVMSEKAKMDITRRKPARRKRRKIMQMFGRPTKDKGDTKGNDKKQQKKRY